jgi:hypothetical protein
VNSTPPTLAVNSNVDGVEFTTHQPCLQPVPDTPATPEPSRGGTRYRISYGHATDTPTVPTMVRITAIRNAKHASATSAVRAVDCEIRKLADKNSKPSAISSR